MDIPKLGYIIPMELPNKFNAQSRILVWVALWICVIVYAELFFLLKMSGISLQSIFNLGREKFDYSDPGKAPHLIYRGSGGGFTDYALTNQETTIGRGKNNHIIIKEDGDKLSKKYTVSKMHASILRERKW